MKPSPTSRTLASLRADGWTVAITEKWNPHAMIRQDLYGFADLLAHKPGTGILAVQACAGSSLAARRDKVLAEPRVRSWLASGGLVAIYAWRKIGKRGARKLWAVRIDGVVLGPDGVPVAREDVCHPPLTAAQGDAAEAPRRA